MADATVTNSEIYEASLAAARTIIKGLIPFRDGRSPYFPDVVSSPDIFRTEVTRLGIDHVPACGLRLETMRQYREDKNFQALKHVRGHTRLPDRTYTRHNLTRVQTDLNVYYYDDDFTSAKQFCKNWLSQLQFTLNLRNADISVGCHLALGDTITIPMREFGQTGNLYNIESGIILTSYVGTVQRLSLTKQIDVSINLLGNPPVAVDYKQAGDGPPNFSARFVGLGYWDRLNSKGYVAITAGHGLRDWQEVPPPEILTDWQIEIVRASDGSTTLHRII